MLASSSSDGTIKLWSSNNQVKEQDIPGEKITFSPDYQKLARTEDGHSIKVDNIEDKRELVLKGDQREVDSISFSPDGKALVVG